MSGALPGPNLYDRRSPGPGGPTPRSPVGDSNSGGVVCSTGQLPVHPQPIGPPLPDVVNSGKMGLRGYPEGLNCQQAFEGTTTPDLPPPRLCLSSYYSQTTADQPKVLESFDIDSICGLAKSLSFAKEGITWFPEINTSLNVTANVHFGIPVPPPLEAPAEAPWEAAPLSRIPHYAFGQVKGWASIFVYFVFPRLYHHPRADQPRRGQARHPTNREKLERTLLSKDQYSLWYDAALMPAIYNAVKVYNSTGQLVTDSNIMQHLPRSRAAASQMAMAPAESFQSGSFKPDRGVDSAADSPHKGRQMISFVLEHKHLERLTEALRERIRSSPECQVFNDFVLYFACKNIKVDFMASSAANDQLRLGLNLITIATTFLS